MLWPEKTDAPQRPAMHQVISVLSQKHRAVLKVPLHLASPLQGWASLSQQGTSTSRAKSHRAKHLQLLAQGRKPNCHLQHLAMLHTEVLSFPYFAF